MELLGAYRNGNYRTLIMDDGTKIRRTNDDDFIPDFAENIDIKITNKCNMNCPITPMDMRPLGRCRMSAGLVDMRRMMSGSSILPE